MMDKTRAIGGDRHADILWRNAETGVVQVWLMDGLTVKGGGVVGQVDTNWDIEKLSDLNGDGRADLIWRSADGYVVAWTMDGATATGGSVILGVSPDWHLV